MINFPGLHVVDDMLHVMKFGFIFCEFFHKLLVQLGDQTLQSFQMLHGFVGASEKNTADVVDKADASETTCESRVFLAERKHVQVQDRHKRQYYPRKACERVEFQTAVAQPIPMRSPVLGWQGAFHHKVPDRIHWVFQAFHRSQRFAEH